MLTTRPFGRVNGSEIDLFSLQNDKGTAIEVMNYGGIVKSITVADREGRCANIALGLDTLDEYVSGNSQYFGAAVGRFANRIARGTFELEGRNYTLACNDGRNHLHGGLKGFDKVVWAAEPIERAQEAGVVLSYTSPDGEEGYPGTLDVTLTYSLNVENEFIVEFQAQTDKLTPVNLTFHGYWNLAGESSGNILGHELMLHCAKYLLVNDEYIPQGTIADAAGTPMDFTTGHTIGEQIDELPGGYDHCYVVDQSAGDLNPIAEVHDPSTGRIMQLLSTEPGVQFYSGNFLQGVPGYGESTYAKHAALCLEAQHFPDSPNQPGFPSVVLRPGDRYFHKTVHRFLTR